MVNPLSDDMNNDMGFTREILASRRQFTPAEREKIFGSKTG
ncbi:hypothetical protein [Methanosarcina sp.]|nr:hypothetical protein [Methanosarcina sp.]HOW14232.1 hypothetical protein [Methanosarcina sp.]